MTSRRRYKSTADVLETVLADSASESTESSSSTSEYFRSSAESSAGDDVDSGQSSGRKKKVPQRAEVDGGWTNNTADNNVDPLVFTGNSGCVTPLQSEEPLLLIRVFVSITRSSSMMLHAAVELTQGHQSNGFVVLHSFCRVFYSFIISKHVYTMLSCNANVIGAVMLYCAVIHMFLRFMYVSFYCIYLSSFYSMCLLFTTFYP